MGTIQGRNDGSPHSLLVRDSITRLSLRVSESRVKTSWISWTISFERATEENLSTPPESLRFRLAYRDWRELKERVIIRYEVLQRTRVHHDPHHIRGPPLAGIRFFDLRHLVRERILPGGRWSVDMTMRMPTSRTDGMEAEGWMDAGLDRLQLLSEVRQMASICLEKLVESLPGLNGPDQWCPPPLGEEEGPYPFVVTEHWLSSQEIHLELEFSQTRKKMDILRMGKWR